MDEFYSTVLHEKVTITQFLGSLKTICHSRKLPCLSFCPLNMLNNRVFVIILAGPVTIDIKTLNKLITPHLRTTTKKKFSVPYIRLLWLVAKVTGDLECPQIHHMSCKCVSDMTTACFTESGCQDLLEYFCLKFPNNGLC